MDILFIAGASRSSASLNQRITRSSRASASKMLESLNLTTLVGRGSSDPSMSSIPEASGCYTPISALNAESFNGEKSR